MVKQILLALFAQAAQSNPPAVPAAPDSAAPMKHYGDPYAAYSNKAYDQALEGFVDLQVEHPNDPALMFNVGSAHYQMHNYADAEKAFSQAAMAGDPALREQALYNLGNVAFRQGKLDEAINHYQAALAVNPDDADAKYNLEFTRDEIRRRHEAAQKQQQERQNNPQDQNQQQQQQQQGEQDKKEENEQKSGEQQQQQQADQPEKKAQEPNQQQEQAAAQEPNKAANPNEAAGQEATQGQPSDKPPDGSMSQAEAEHYLENLEESRPKPQVKGNARRARGKDW